MSATPRAPSVVTMVVFRVRGVPIRVGWSWLVIVALVYWSLSTVLFPTSYEGLATWVYLVMLVCTLSPLARISVS